MHNVVLISTFAYGLKPKQIDVCYLHHFNNATYTYPHAFDSIKTKKSWIEKLSAEHQTSVSAESHIKLQAAQEQSTAVFPKLDLICHWKENNQPWDRSVSYCKPRSSRLFLQQLALPYHIEWQRSHSDAIKTCKKKKNLILPL